MTEHTTTMMPIERESPSTAKAKNVLIRTRMEWVKLISATLVPIMIAVFTLVTTVQQLASDKASRLTDLRIADEQRYKDLYLAEELRRQLVFDTFITEMGPLVEQTDDLSETQRTLASSRIHAAFAQLDGTRKGHLIEFLYQGGLIRQNMPGKFVSLAGVNLDNIVFQPRTISLDLQYASFASASLQNASFVDIGLYEVTFQDCVLTSARFAHAFLTGTNFMNAIMHKVDMTHAYSLLTIFNGADMTGATIPDDVLFGYENVFDDVIFPNGTHQATIRPKNLISKNPGAEQDLCVPSNAFNNVSGWFIHKDDIVTAPYGPSDSPFDILLDNETHGNCYFWGRGYGLKSQVMSMEYRLIDLVSFRHLIRAGHAACRMSFWLGGVSGREDYAEVRLLWLNYPYTLKTIDLGKTHSVFLAT
jgi:uncharacterized protein YjbI with pentapeptide repeats